jgi:DNA polymerase I
VKLGQMFLLLQVAKVDLKKETPVGHGEIISFSIYSFSGERKADFGDGKCCIWVDVLDGEGCSTAGKKNLLMEFGPFFEDKSIKKVISFCCKLSFILEQNFASFIRFG